MNESTQETEDVIATGSAARSLLASDALQKAIDNARTLIVRNWECANTTEERERLHAEYCAIPTVIRNIKILFDRGEEARRGQDPSYEPEADA